MKFLCTALIGIGLLTSCTDQKQQQAEQLYVQNCKVCHAQGINGAPVVGNAKMWNKRTGQGREILIQHAIDGYGLMPAKGGNEALTDAEIAMIVDYMLSQLSD